MGFYGVRNLNNIFLEELKPILGGKKGGTVTFRELDNVSYSPECYYPSALMSQSKKGSFYQEYKFNKTERGKER